MPRPLCVSRVYRSNWNDKVMGEEIFGPILPVMEYRDLDAALHLVSPYLPFGGVGSSGMGAYHGRHSFDTFSHKKSVLKKSTRVKLDFLYPPYSASKLNVIKKFMK